MIEKLEWDSAFFGYQVGKVILKSIDEYDLINLVNERSMKLIYIFSDVPVIHDKLFHSDTKVVFHKNLHNILDKLIYQSDCITYDEKIFSYHKLEELTIESGKFSRFRIDPKFKNNEFEKLYKEWISKSCRKEIALEVLVYMVNKELAGFITITKKSKTLSDIGLIAVNPRYQGKGIGSILIKAAEEYSIRNGFTEIQVVTQEFNKNAVKLYLKNNFKLDQRTFVYHYWK